MMDIKYYHNEMANHLAKLIAFKMAVESRNDNAITSAINTLLGTERNFILKAGETTIEIEKNKIDLTNSKSLLDFFKGTIGAFAQTKTEEKKD
jgi:hypothetical protein